MVDKEVQVTLVGKDDLSPVVDKAADAVDDLEKKHVQLPVEAIVDEVFADFRKVDDAADALEADDVEIVLKAKVDDLKGQLKEAENALEKTTGKTRELGNASDQSGSVMANMVGNSAQDLGELGGVAGTAGVAVGQLAEYAADGTVSLKGFANVAVPMLAMAAVTKVIGDHMKKVAEARAFRRDQVDGWVKAVKEGATAVGAMEDSFREIGKVEVDLGGDDFGDITPQLAELNLSMEDFTRLTAMSDDELREWSRGQAAAGKDTKALALVVMGASNTAEQLTQAEKDAAAATKVFGDEAENSAGKVMDVGVQWDAMSDKLSDRSAFLDVEDAFDNVKTAAEEAYLAAVFGAADAEQKARDLERAQIDLRQKVEDYSQEIGEIPGTAETILSLIDNGDLAGAEAALNRIELDRVTNWKVNLAPGSGWGAQNWRHWLDTGSPAPAMAGGGAVGQSFNYTVNMPRGTRGTDLIDTMNRHARRNGATLR